MKAKIFVHESQVPITAMVITDDFRINREDKNPYPMPDYIVSSKGDGGFYMIKIKEVGLKYNNLLLPLILFTEQDFPIIEAKLEKMGCKVILRISSEQNNVTGFCGWLKDSNETPLIIPNTFEQLQQQWKEWQVIKENVKKDK